MIHPYINILIIEDVPRTFDPNCTLITENLTSFMSYVVYHHVGKYNAMVDTHVGRGHRFSLTVTNI